MFDTCEITFSARDFFLEDDPMIRPTPAVKLLPDWYKNLEPYFEKKEKSPTIKKCIPFRDALCAGYLLRAPKDLFFLAKPSEHNENDLCWVARNDNPIASMMHLNVNTSSKSQMHPTTQLGGDKCPLVHKNQKRNFFKIINPFNIHTPKGYSCLFMPPLNRFSDKFEIIQGIVDTDEQHVVNFPIIIKSKNEEVIIKKGEPYAQVFPFKRDNWKMNIKQHTMHDDMKYDYWYSTKIQDWYRKFKHKAKKWI